MLGCVIKNIFNQTIIFKLLDFMIYGAHDTLAAFEI